MKHFIIIFLLWLACSNINSQIKPLSDNIYSFVNNNNNSNSVSSLTTVSIGIGTILYLVNPILLYENKRIYAGITKEISVGFGKMGQNRFAFEYSFVFAGNISHHFRFSYKYDFLLKDKIEPSHTLQGTAVLSPGTGYFTNFVKHGFFPELTFGYSIRNHKILIYPHVKIRHTFMFKKQESDITDVSFGIIFGFSNPFIDVNIKRHY